VSLLCSTCIVVSILLVRTFAQSHIVLTTNFRFETCPTATEGLHGGVDGCSSGLYGRCDRALNGVATRTTTTA
jgi:hypothetical protein